MNETASLLRDLDVAGVGEAFAEEKEWRLVVFPGEGREEELMNFLPAANGLKPYVEVPVIGVNNRIDLDSVVIGPGRESERSLQSAKMFLKKHGYENPDLVRPSLAPYRGR